MPGPPDKDQFLYMTGNDETDEALLSAASATGWTIGPAMLRPHGANGLGMPTWAVVLIGNYPSSKP